MTDAQDGLFAASDPEHPDAPVARELVTGYYEERAEEAREALAKAQALFDARFAELVAWTHHGEITHDTLAGRIDMTPHAIVAHADSAHMAAMRAAIPELGGKRSAATLAAAEDAKQRAQAVRRWLTAQGFRLGELAAD